MPDRRAAKRVNDHNRLAFTCKASIEQRCHTIRLPNFLRAIARNADMCAALRVCRRLWTRLGHSKGFALRGDRKGLCVRLTTCSMRRSSHNRENTHIKDQKDEREGHPPPKYVAK